MNKVLIIPDIHGRTFWKEDVTSLLADIDSRAIDVVFLGDYVDPYPEEGISDEDAVRNFRLIVDLAKGRENVHLLLGNHDLHYFKEHFVGWRDRCRYSIKHADEIKSLFRDNHSLFKIAWQTTINNKQFMFTHAGILKNWMKSYANTDYVPTQEYLNRLLRSKNGLSILACISLRRGGYALYGSPVWADLMEHLYADDDYHDEFYQIFGHTHLSTERLGDEYKGKGVYIASSSLAMLDAKTSFILSEYWQIKPIGVEPTYLQDDAWIFNYTNNNQE